ncbi:hypothetical protein NYZ94_05230 [Ligilactobacillus salivarius]|nr:hypothetical protein NYZ94_04870 [Ligilactobacillus salivarius]UXI85295.1 hypothetical protein NYZ94_05230 [Ligilactobacillus salivarius]
MEIEYRNKDYRKKNIFRVGNVIEHDGFVYLVSSYANPGVFIKYFLVDLINGWTYRNKMYDSLEELSMEFNVVKSRLVKAKLTVDYKLDGDEESEDNE